MIPKLNLLELEDYLWPVFDDNGVPKAAPITIPKKAGDWSILECNRVNQYIVLRYDLLEDDIVILRFYPTTRGAVIEPTKFGCSRVPNCPEIRMSIEVKDKINPIYLYRFKQSEIEQAQKVYDRKIEALTIFLGV